MADSTWTLEHLKEYFEEQLRQRDLRIEQQNRYDERAIEAAFAANTEKLKSMNEFREALNDSALRNITRQEAESRIQALQDKFDATIGPLEDKIDTIRRPNWTLLSVVASVIVALCAGIWMIIGLQISTAETPIALEVSQIKEQLASRDRATIDATANNSTALGQQNERLHAVEDKLTISQVADEQSRTDRAQLNMRLRDAERSIAENAAIRRGEIASINAALIEVETQFCANDEIRNLQHASDARILAMLWARTHPSEHLPTDNSFYPKICHGGQPNPSDRH